MKKHLLYKKYKPPIHGETDWIYWIDIKKWKNALVFDNTAERITQQLKLYFEHVYSIKVKTPEEYTELISDWRLDGLQYDLIFCTYLFQGLSTNRKNASAVLERLHYFLSERGKLIFGYMNSSNVLGYLINLMLNNNKEIGFLDFCELNKGKNISKLYYKSIEKSKDFKQVKRLFVYPSHAQPWTISDSDLFALKIADWKKKTRRNSIAQYIMSNGLFKYWWPHLIMIYRKNKNDK